MRTIIYSLLAISLLGVPLTASADPDTHTDTTVSPKDKKNAKDDAADAKQKAKDAEADAQRDAAKAKNKAENEATKAKNKAEYEGDKAKDKIHEKTAPNDTATDHTDRNDTDTDRGR